MGEKNEDIDRFGIFVWDTDQKQIFQIDLGDTNILPTMPNFLNAEGNEIVFAGYEK